MKFIKLEDRQINVEQIVSIEEQFSYYYIRMSNADCYRIEKTASNVKKVEELLNADIQLSSKRTTTRTNRSVQ